MTKEHFAVASVPSHSIAKSIYSDTRDFILKRSLSNARFALLVLPGDLLARHIRLIHEAESTSPFETEADHSRVTNYQTPSISGAAHDSLNSVSPPRFRIRHQEAPTCVESDVPSDQTPIGNGFTSFPSSPSIQPSAPRATSAMLPLVSPIATQDILPTQQPNGFGDFDLFIDSLNGAYGYGLSSFYVDQPILPSPPAPLFPIVEPRLQWHTPNSELSKQSMTPTSVPRLFDDFTSSLPSFEPSRATRSKKEPFHVTQQDWDSILTEAQKFLAVLPQGFFLPSRHTMTRYINTYFAGFHRHLPLVHLPTFLAPKCPIELMLAMATIGAISAFDRNNATMLYRASLAISQERLRHRKKQRHDMVFSAGPRPPSMQQTRIMQNLPVISETSQHDAGPSTEQISQFDPLPLAQALLILMAMATWGNSEAIFDEAIEIQSILANYLRTEKLLEPQIFSSTSAWSTWIKEEGFRRTVAIIFCFFIFHTIVYDLPPPILNSELNIHLPSREKDWEAKTEDEWRQARDKHEAEPHFQSTFGMLFSSQAEDIQNQLSSLGSYTLILALIQHIYFLRMEAKRRPEGEQSLSPMDMNEIERALKNWQSGWNQDPESFLGPGSPLGPISFNSTALLRMAYIRLNVDLGPWRALNTHVPHEVAASIHRSPPLSRNRRLTRAVLYSAHALSIPVKIGVNIVAHNQSFSWSLQHSLCALECAFIISKWLIAIQPHLSQETLDEEEARLYAYIVDMVMEAEAGGDVESSSTSLCTRVVSIWARILSGTAHWNVVPMIGKILEAYAQILEPHPT
ncbi:hypothetical protein N7533_004139 [Penicillium manginii]|uniref:uncharacterized protein n=1 Tax=Penicillium manginii TaxID=203109 RepID=UPI002546E601|nr:uncharacterized protein N7533_004139 [Penicillium manginii]KAJ5754596.1 hypothetical protein N7533_004139 [Penicillium manginii]